MTEGMTPGMFDIYEPDFYKPKRTDEMTGRTATLVEQLRALDQFIVEEGGSRGNPFEVMRIVGANEVFVCGAVFDVATQQQVGIGTLYMRDHLHPDDRRPMFDSTIIIGSEYMRNGYASLVRNYIMNHMAGYHENGIWVLGSAQASPKHRNAAKKTIRNTGAEKLPRHPQATHDLWGQIAMPNDSEVPASISVDDLVFTHRITGEQTKLDIPDTKDADGDELLPEQVEALLQNWQDLRKKGYKVRAFPE